MTTTALTPARPVARPVASAIVAAAVVVLGVLALIGIRLADAQSPATPRPQPITVAPGGNHGAPGAHRAVSGLSGSPYSEWPPAAKTLTTSRDRNHDW
jgi:hypothetical protein